MKLKKLLALGIIFLFIGVAVAPSINSSVKPSDDLVEVTSQACGIQGFGNTTVKLTKQQYQDLEQYLVDFQARLNQTSTREEAIPIFKDAVVELNKYGLLPMGLSIGQVQRLVTIGYRVQHALNIIRKSSQNSINYFCLFAAILSGGYPSNIWTRIASWLLQNAFSLAHPLFALALAFVIVYIDFLEPLHFINGIDVLGDEYTQSFFSIGLKGIQSGPHNISKVLGFTGLMIVLNVNDVFCLGFAVDILD